MHLVRGAESRGTPWKLAWLSTENMSRKETVSVALHWAGELAHLAVSTLTSALVVLE